MNKKGSSTIRSTRNSESKKNLFTLLGVFVIGFILTAGSVAWGRADGGVINVSEIIRNANAAAVKRAEETGEEAQIIRNTRPKSKNGGLIGKGDPEPPPQKENEAADNASSTEDNASSTDDGAESDDSEESESANGTENQEPTEEIVE